LKSCTMIITEPNEFATEIHDRMPVFFTEEQFAPWLSGPVPNDYLQRWPVSKRVNSSKADADDPSVIERVEVAAAYICGALTDEKHLAWTAFLEALSCTMNSWSIDFTSWHLNAAPLRPTRQP